MAGPFSVVRVASGRMVRSGRAWAVAAVLAMIGCSTAPSLEEARFMPRFGQPQWAATRPTTSPAYAYSARVQSDAGWDFLRQGRLDDAIDDFNAAWSIDPSDPSALWGMAVVQMERAKLTGQPNERGLGLIDEACGLFGDAMREEAIGQTPADPQLKIDAAWALAVRGGYRQALKVKGAETDFDEADRLLQKAAQAGPSQHLYQTRAALDQYRGDVAAAAEDDRRAATQPAMALGPPPSTMPAPVAPPASPKPTKPRPAKARPTSRHA